MNYQIVIILILTMLIGCVYFYYKNELQQTKDGVVDLIRINTELKYTIKLGIYQRFYRNYLLPEKEQPRDFEYFVAEIMEIIHGSRTFVTPSSGDFGVDVEETRKDGLYLGQMKCKESSVDYEPIAIIHSRMIKDGAQGGYVVTTSKFSDKAKEYHQQLGANIELIEGDQLVDLYLKCLEERAELASLKLQSVSFGQQKTEPT